MTAQRSNNPPQLPAGQLVAMFEKLQLIRQAEEYLIKLFADGEVPGFIHLSIGQEAVSVGAMSALRDDDTIASTHRGHGHALAKGMKLEGFFAELLGKQSGLCKGRGGSMHVADMSIGMLGANGIVGAGLSIALGSALSHKTLGRDAIAAAFFGDAATAEGLLHECLNMAALWQLPLLFVCENNGWGEFLPTAKQVAFGLAALAAAYKLPHVMVDGNDVTAVALAAAEIVAGMRNGGGPVVLECKTKRIRGHYEGDAQKYRNPEEFGYNADSDPLAIAARQLAAHDIGEPEIAAIVAKIKGEIEAAVQAAKAGAQPEFEASRSGVYTEIA